MSCGSVIRANVHARLAKRLATAALRFAVDDHAALRAGSHPAQRPARLARHRAAKSRDAGARNRRRDDAAGGHANLAAIYAEMNFIRHDGLGWTAHFNPENARCHDREKGARSFSLTLLLCLGTRHA